MNLTVLLENTTCGAAACAHGLSFYIETERHRILFDAGPKGNLLRENAALLGIDLSAVDIAFLSHGHYDHSGGLAAFLQMNGHAPVYLHSAALQPHYAMAAPVPRYIGIDHSIAADFNERLFFTDGICTIDETLLCFSDVKTADYLSGSNHSLLEPDGTGYQPDRFLHEQNLLIRENGKVILLAGCAHRGIVNILRRAAEIAGRVPDAVYAGFHLTNPDRGADEPEALIRSVGAELLRWPCRFYTGHCTGTGPYAILKEYLGDRLTPLSSGKQFLE